MKKKPQLVFNFLIHSLYLLAGAVYLAYPIHSITAASLEDEAWPLFGFSAVETHLYRWEEKFFAVNKKGLLYKFDFVDHKLKKKEIYEYPSEPDIIKHFLLESGDLFVAVFKKEKKVILNAFDVEGDEIYSDSFDLDFVVELADIRVNKKGRPVCIFYYYEDYNYVISKWTSGNLEEIYRIHYPIDHIFFQQGSDSKKTSGKIKKNAHEKNETIHMLHQKNNDYYWSVWSRKNYYEVWLPFHILTPNFFSIGRYTFLVGVDPKGNLWRFTLSKNKLIRSKLAYNYGFKFIHQIIPIVYQKTFQLIMPSKESNVVWRLQFSNFFRNIKIGKLARQKTFWAYRIHLLNYRDELYIMIETENRHIYFQKWNSSRLHLYNFKWEINANRKRSDLKISWETPRKRSKKKKYLYYKFLDQKKNSEPIGELTSLPGNSIKISNLPDGHHTLHIQAVDSKNKKSSLYHIPLFWLYDPPEPEVIFLNSVSPSAFLPGVLKFYIKNQTQIDYYYAINQIPKYEPTRKLNLRQGVASVDINFKTGWYYLHIRSRDPKSKKYSTILDVPFFINPFDPDSEHLDIKTDSLRVKIRALQKSILKNKKNSAKLKKIQERLKELQKELIN